MQWDAEFAGRVFHYFVDGVHHDSTNGQFICGGAELRAGLNGPADAFGFLLYFDDDFQAHTVLSGS